MKKKDTKEHGVVTTTNWYILNTVQYSITKGVVKTIVAEDQDAVPVQGLEEPGGEVGEVGRRVEDEEDGVGHAQLCVEVRGIFSIKKHSSPIHSC